MALLFTGLVAAGCSSDKICSTAGCSTAECTGGIPDALEVDSSDAVIQVRLPTNPMTIALTVTRDGSDFTTKTLVPEYTTTTRNGPGCRPTCTVSQDTVRL